MSNFLGSVHDGTNPTLETGILSIQELQKFKAWLDERNWWYVVKK
ncbi:N-acetylmuramoyl-L-alanine amidase C-terminal domain-containing protein [Bacillus cereus]|nr:N-acetylmuramoyl-L-alanine amidase C-terminal domain-containing protein [Bacillus cereus]